MTSSLDFSPAFFLSPPSGLPKSWVRSLTSLPWVETNDGNPWVEIHGGFPKRGESPGLQARSRSGVLQKYSVRNSCHETGTTVWYLFVYVISIDVLYPGFDGRAYNILQSSVSCRVASSEWSYQQVELELLFHCTEKYSHCPGCVQALEKVPRPARRKPETNTNMSSK